jgi:hypothetical protein
VINNISGSTQQEEIIYKYFRQRATVRSPLEIIGEFKNLLLLTKKSNSEVSDALETVLASTSQQQVNIILNNCCYIILDCWLKNSYSISDAPQLLDIFKIVDRTNTYNRHRKELIQSIRNYRQSESFFRLKGIVAIINSKRVERADLLTLLSENSDFHTNNKLDTYLSRYTYLYSYFVPQTYHVEHLTTLIEKLRQERQKNFEFELSRHIIYRFRLKQHATTKLSTIESNSIAQVDNPSLLSEIAFQSNLKSHLQKVNNYTLLESALLFNTQNQLNITYKAFKKKLFQFMTANIIPKNDYDWEKRLKSKLDNIFAESNDKPINSGLILQTCRQLLSHLIIDLDSKDTSKFTELITNLGTVQTTIVMTKIALICPESQADLKKKICGIIACHQEQSVTKILWLMRILEHLLVSFSICFGDIDVSLAKSLINEQ